MSSVVVGLPHPELGSQTHAIIEIDPAKDAYAVVASLPKFLGDRLSKYKHPESYEIAHESYRDGAGKVRTREQRPHQWHCGAQEGNG